MFLICKWLVIFLVYILPSTNTQTLQFILMNLLEISLFFIVPFVAAAINSVAGGGTFLTFPVFIMSGLSPLQANVMSTIALWPGTLSSSLGYRSHGSRVMTHDNLTALFIICILGGTLGSITLLNTPEKIFSWLVPWLLLIATLIFTFGKYGIDYLRTRFPASGNHRDISIFFQFLISFYGGYFGAGIGILMLAMLQLMGMNDIHQMNALKVRLAAFINAATALIFLFSGLVVWQYAWIMIAGGVLGGYVGARTALKLPPQKLRIFVSFVGFAMSAYFFIR